MSQQQVEDFLAHHGVKGMKWGVRNERDRSNRVGMSDDEAVVALYGSVLAATILLKGGEHFVQSGKVHSLATKGKAFLTGKPYWQKKPSLADPKMGVDEIMSSVVKPINPKYDSGGMGTRMNCRRATFAYEMRRRGYDVAATRTTNASGQTPKGVFKALKSSKDTPYKEFSKKFLATGLERIPSGSDPFKTIGKHPSGARGEMTVMWAMGGGHSVAWENIKGKPTIIDTQSGKKFENRKEWDAAFPIPLREAGITRLDDKELNTKFLARWLQDA
jgi:hypothetical protein